MWIVIVIIVVVIIGKFLLDCSKQAEQVRHEGGMMKKYSILVEHLLNHPNARIFQETNTFISIGISSSSGSTVYYLQQTFGNITIQMKVKNDPFVGNFNMEWTFPESMVQERMIAKIEEDIQRKLFNY